MQHCLTIIVIMNNVTLSDTDVVMTNVTLSDTDIIMTNITLSYIKS